MNNDITIDIINDNNSSLKEIIRNFDKIPNYLIKQNEHFQEFIRTTLPIIGGMNSSEDIENLQQISIIIYKIKLIEIYQDLWNTYLKSGTGQLFNNSKQTFNYTINVSIWPKVLKQQMKLTTFDGTDLYNTYFKFVQLQLTTLNQHLKYYRNMLNININILKNYSSDFQKLIENYVEENIFLLRIYIEHQIELVHYNYHIDAIKMEFMRHNPHSFQVHLMKEICSAKYDQEASEQSYLLIQKQLKYYNSSIYSSEYSSLTCLDTIESLDSEIKYQVNQPFKDRVEEIQYLLLILDEENTREEMMTYKIQYDHRLDQFCQTCLVSTRDSQSFLLMINLLEQRCSKIAERLQCIYRYKTRCIGTKAYI